MVWIDARFSFNKFSFNKFVKRLFMEISISFSSIIQVVSLIFFAGGSYVLIQYKLKEFSTRQINIEAEVTKMHDQIKDFQHTSISRKEAFDNFVAKEILELHLRSLEKSMEEIKNMVKAIHDKRGSDQ